MQKTLIIIDGHAIAYRAYFALPNTMTRPDGLHTNSIYGFTSMLNSILSKYKPDYISMVFDRREPTFRHKQYPEYKAHRPTPDQEFIEQMPILKTELCEAYSIPMYDLAGYEADDIIGTMAKKLASKQLKVIIVTGDKDSFQLVDENISVLTPKKGLKESELYTPEKVKERYNLEPSQIIDLKGLMGDTSDNIPGVKGVGEKTAIKLLSEYGSIQNTLNNIENIPQKALKSKLETDKEQALLSYELATICTSVPIKTNLEDMHTKVDTDKLNNFYKQMNFLSLVSNKKITGNYQMIETLDQLNKLKTELIQADEFSFDTETTSTESLNCELVGISFCLTPKKAYYIHFDNTEKCGNNIQGSLFAEPISETNNCLSKTSIIKTLKEIFQTNNTKIAHNIKFDINVLSQYDIDVNGLFFDTMIADYLVEPTRSMHNLKFLSSYYLQLEMTEITELIGKGKDQISMADVSPKEITDYCCADSDATMRIKQILTKTIKEKNLERIFYEIEMPLVPVLIEMEQNGISLNTAHLNNLSETLDIQIKEEEKHITILAGEEFNIASPKQLGVILFEKLGLPIIKKTKSGPSTDVRVLEQLALMDFEIAKRIIKFRQLAKLKNTYVDALPELVNNKTNKIHTTFNQAIAATGRLSSTNPNLQNIPVKSELGKEIRAAFIPENPDNVLFSIDYSQMELRILAELSQDKILLDAYKEGKDIHALTASLVFNVFENMVTPEMRSQAKAVNFGIIYGMGPKKLSDEIKVSIKDAKMFIDTYFEVYQGIKIYLDKVIEEAEKSQEIATFYGRKRELSDIVSSNYQVRESAKRIATNMPIQGTAADIMKIKMIEISQILKNLPYKVKMLLQVHDELIFEIAENNINDFQSKIEKIMQTVPEMSLCFETGSAWGKNWKAAK